MQLGTQDKQQSDDPSMLQAKITMRPCSPKLPMRILRHIASLYMLCMTGGMMKWPQHTLSSQGHARLWVASQAMLPSWCASPHKGPPGTARKPSSKENSMLRLKQSAM